MSAGIDSGSSGSVQGYNVPEEAGQLNKLTEGGGAEAVAYIKGFLGGDEEGAPTTKGTDNFKDEVSSARSGGAIYEAQAEVETQTSGTRDARLEVGTPEFKAQVLAEAESSLKANLGMVSMMPGAPSLTLATLTSDQLATLPKFFAPQSPADKARNGDQNTVGTQAFKNQSEDTVMGFAEIADGIQAQIGPDNFRALINDPTEENLSQYPQLTAEQKNAIQDPTFAAVINGMDKVVSDHVNRASVSADFVERLNIDKPELGFTAEASGQLAPADGNPFFAVALTSVLKVFFMEMAKTQNQIILLESKNLIASMNRTWSLAESAADMIEKSAMAQAMMYMVSAMMNAVSFAASAYSLGGMMKAKGTAQDDYDKRTETLTDRQKTTTAAYADHNNSGLGRNTTLRNADGSVASEINVLKGRDQKVEFARREQAVRDGQPNQKLSVEEQAQFDRLKRNRDIDAFDTEKTRLQGDKTKAESELIDHKQNQVKFVDQRTNEIFWERALINDLVKAGTGTIENAVNATVTLIKGQLDAALKMNEAASKINDQAGQSAGKAMQDARDAFRAIMDAQDRSMGAIMKAFAINTRG